jgi:cell filamentation protein, protein adenylyltransferase
MAHEYSRTHPWLTFGFRLEYDGDARLWALLGEAYSKCQHLSGAPLTPAVADELSCVYLVKGAVATTAIEGNTLTEDEARAILDGERRLPPSQHYLQQEIENVVRALRLMDEATRQGRRVIVSPEWIREQNRLVLEDLTADDHVVPGEYTSTRVVVGNYRGAPPADIPYLMDRLTGWLAELTGTRDEPANLRFYNAFLAAVLAHLYIAWIHPFGDGNGRTARLVECAILASSGTVAWVSANLLSDHYNRTRTEYYRRLDRASKACDVAGFVSYAAQGFVDLLREQIEVVQRQQLAVSWVSYAHEQLATLPNTEATARQRKLLLSMPDAAIPITALRRLTAELAELYASKSDKTVSRDVNRLVALGLVHRDMHSVRPALDLMEAFTPGK